MSVGRSKHWKNIVAKDGGFSAEILARWPTEKEAFEHEKFLIKCFRDLGIHLCNMTDGGEGISGNIRSDETIAKMSLSASGKRNPNYGKVFSKETRTRMSQASTRTMADPAVRAKISLASKNRTHTNETRALIRSSWLDPELRSARIVAMKEGWAKRLSSKVSKLQIAEGACV